MLKLDIGTLMRLVLITCLILSFSECLSPSEQSQSISDSSQSCSSPNNCSNVNPVSQSYHSKHLLEVPNTNTCAGDVAVHDLSAECLICEFNYTCVYGQIVNVTCTPNIHGQKSKIKVVKQMKCEYCYQTESKNHLCSGSARCRVNSAPPSYYVANCTVKSDLLCLGNRIFSKNIKCNWTRGYKWSTALILSITLGGFGVDRFYLGMWQEGIGKLFSFGGIGVWTIVDVILIATGYLGPADGSLYIN